MDGIEVHSALSEAFEIMGLCPQENAYNDNLTTSELLMLFAVSSGLSERQATQVSN